MSRPSESLFAQRLGVFALLSVLQILVLPLVEAAPPNGRMPPEERHRLRQEVRQHSGAYHRQPMQAVPAANPGGPPIAIPQNSAPGNGAMPPFGQPGLMGHPGSINQPGPPSNMGAGRMAVPGGGKLSEEDRRALRQQLREQHRAHREVTVGGP